MHSVNTRAQRTMYLYVLRYANVNGPRSQFVEFLFGPVNSLDIERELFVGLRLARNEILRTTRFIHTIAFRFKSCEFVLSLTLTAATTVIIIIIFQMEFET